MGKKRLRVFRGTPCSRSPATGRVKDSVRLKAGFMAGLAISAVTVGRELALRLAGGDEAL